MSTNITFRTEEKYRDRLDRIAADLDRNRNWVLNKAVENYLELYDWELQEIDAGLADIEAGRTVSADEIRAEFNLDKKKPATKTKTATRRKK